MAQDQKRCIPPHVAEAITAHVGDNDLMNGPELRSLAMGAHEKLWEPFFEQQLKPFAERGVMKAWLTEDNMSWYFPDVSEECLLDLFKRKEVVIEKTTYWAPRRGPPEMWELSW
ncbi:unnamed protein product [Polarella glacialis]|uniref:Uncharacterized protein n=1 Tax=Polarella glacialis TaxID=89957 RepID=A0A813DZW4_POLGL|nr:unnamed protein product [Polarella glacialis]CAE8664764.1 unnamed protein product [Polarella glacialis]